MTMTRAQAIAIIEHALPTADEATLSAVATLLQEAACAESVLPRDLTQRELEQIEQSKEDFRMGRVLSNGEYHADMDAFMARLRAKLTAPS